MINESIEITSYGDIYEKRIDIPWWEFYVSAHSIVYVCHHTDYPTNANVTVPDMNFVSGILNTAYCFVHIIDEQ